MSASDVKRRVCVVTSNRSDWSKLRPVAVLLKNNPGIELSVIAVGSHLLEEFGHTVDEVAADFPGVVRTQTTVAGDQVSAMVDSVGFGIVKISNALSHLKPATCVIHGDRFEALAAAIAANLSNIVVMHIEGGELSGTVDGYLRHAVTKLSHIHLTCSEDATHRILSMGENAANVFLTGCPSYQRLFSVNDSTWEQSLIDKHISGIKKRRFILAIMHSCVTDEEQSIRDFECLMQALFTVKMKTVFLYPNVDPGNKKMIQILHKYQKINDDWPDWLLIQNHIPPDMFAVLMHGAALMLGNSSAGIRETCVYGTPTLNLGNRQMGRLQPPNVTTLQCPVLQDVLSWIKSKLGQRFDPSSEFGSDKSPELIAEIITNVDLKECRNKSFHEYQHLIPHFSRQDMRSSEGEPMPELPKVLGIITARGGSKGIPGKNIIDLAGKPLIEYTLEAALSSKLLDRCIISTDSEEIAQIANRAGCEVPFLRPGHLAQDDSGHMECIRHAIETLAERENYHAEYVMILQPTSPFRTSDDIDNAISLVLRTSCDAVVGVCRSSVPLMKTFRIDENTCTLTPYACSMPAPNYLRRQDSHPTFCENGAIFLQRTSSIIRPGKLRNGSLFSDDVRGYVMPIERSLDIDEPYDLECARALVVHRRNSA